jgi:hypothetical protein
LSKHLHQLLLVGGGVGLGVKAHPRLPARNGFTMDDTHLFEQVIL